MVSGSPGGETARQRERRALGLGAGVRPRDQVVQDGGQRVEVARDVELALGRAIVQLAGR